MGYGVRNGMGYARSQIQMHNRAPIPKKRKVNFDLHTQPMPSLQLGVFGQKYRGIMKLLGIVGNRDEVKIY